MPLNQLRGMPYQQLVEQAQVNIRGLRERGGGYVGLASLAERLVRTAVRIRVSRARALEQRGRAGRSRGPQHVARRIRAAPLSARPYVLVVPVRRRHQIGRGAAPGRGGGHRAGIDRRAALRRPLRPPRPHGGRGHLRPGKWLEFYLDQIERAAPFPPQYRNVAQPDVRQVLQADFPDPVVPTEAPMIVRTGHSPTERAWTLLPARGGRG
jgi:hypothetical protein